MPELLRSLIPIRYSTPHRVGKLPATRACIIRNPVLLNNTSHRGLQIIQQNIITLCPRERFVHDVISSFYLALNMNLVSENSLIDRKM